VPKWKRGWLWTVPVCFAVMAVLGIFYFGSKHAPPSGETNNPPPSSTIASTTTPDLTVSGSPALDKLDLFIKRNGDPNLEFYQLVDHGSQLLQKPHLQPLAPEDALRLEGKFRKPTYWYLVWFDTAGATTVETHSDTPRDQITFPSKYELTQVDKTNPAGVHLLLLVAGSVAPADGLDLLKGGLVGVGKPPSVLPPTWSRLLLRGSGKRVSADSIQVAKYLEGIEGRLPHDLEAVYALFFQTRK
jgi:hypothetical protein